MKISVSLLLCLTAFATAGGAGPRLYLDPLGKPERLPELVANAAACTDASQRVPVFRTKLESTEIWVLHQCGSSDASTELAFQHDDGWQIYTSATIRDDGAKLGAPPLRIELLRETLAYGTLADDRPALLHRVDTVEWGKTRSRIDVCAREDTRKRKLECDYTTVECPARGCAEPTLLHGVLSVLSARGPVTVPID